MPKLNNTSYNFSNDIILRNIVKQIVRIANPDKIILFGSRTTGTAKEGSDYDICVLKKNIKNERKLAQKIHCDLSGVGASVDVIVKNPRRFEQLKNKWFMVYYDIAKHGKVVYEK